MHPTEATTSTDLCEQHPHRHEPCVDCDFPASESTGGRTLSAKAKQLILKRSTGHCEISVMCQGNWANRFHIRTAETPIDSTTIDTPAAGLHICDRCEWWIDLAGKNATKQMGLQLGPEHPPKDTPVTWRGVPVWLFDDGDLEPVTARKEHP